jgi:hypothetical protein
MDPAIFDDLQRHLTADGPRAAIDRLCSSLREQKEYGELFYALLLKKRYELGLSPVPTGASQDIPEAMQAPYEDAIREAGRLVGRLHLEEGNIPQAWVYFRMLGEPAPVAEALENYRPGEGDDCQQVVEIAFHQGVHPKKGFDMILDRFGLCSAITTVSSRELPISEADRAYCVRRLTRTLYGELVERLKADVERREGSCPDAHTVRELMEGHDWLFEDEFYHVDVSHLGAVVQMSTHLSSGEELRMARELCAYGQRLSPRFKYPGDPPFEDPYRDYGVYLSVLAGEDPEEGLSYFRAKVEQADPEEVGTLPAEVFVNLLLKLDRADEALAVARKHLAAVDDRRLTCPSIADLCNRTRQYGVLVDVARERQDPVHYLAGLLASAQP